MSNSTRYRIPSGISEKSLDKQLLELFDNSPVPRPSSKPLSKKHTTAREKNRAILATRLTRKHHSPQTKRNLDAILNDIAAMNRRKQRKADARAKYKGTGGKQRTKKRRH
jgi:hypothetical protein